MGGAFRPGRGEPADPDGATAPRRYQGTGHRPAARRAPGGSRASWRVIPPRVLSLAPAPSLAPGPAGGALATTADQAPTPRDRSRSPCLRRPSRRQLARRAASNRGPGPPAPSRPGASGRRRLSLPVAPGRLGSEGEGAGSSLPGSSATAAPLRGVARGGPVRRSLGRPRRTCLVAVFGFAGWLEFFVTPGQSRALTQRGRPTPSARPRQPPPAVSVAGAGSEGTGVPRSLAHRAGAPWDPRGLRRWRGSLGPTVPIDPSPVPPRTQATPPSAARPAGVPRPAPPRSETPPAPRRSCPSAGALGAWGGAVVGGGAGEAARAAGPAGTAGAGSSGVAAANRPTPMAAILRSPLGAAPVSGASGAEPPDVALPLALPGRPASADRGGRRGNCLTRPAPSPAPVAPNGSLAPVASTAPGRRRRAQRAPAATRPSCRRGAEGGRCPARGRATLRRRGARRGQSCERGVAPRGGRAGAGPLARPRVGAPVPAGTRPAGARGRRPSARPVRRLTR